jgi:hypothetical protein
MFSVMVAELGFVGEAFVGEKLFQRLFFIGTPRALVGAYKFKNVPVAVAMVERRQQQENEL